MMQRMYIGPAIPGVVKKDTVFSGSLPAELGDALGKIPGIKNLVIPIERITEAKKSLSERGSIENVSYHRAEKYLEGEGTNG